MKLSKKDGAKIGIVIALTLWLVWKGIGEISDPEKRAEVKGQFLKWLTFIIGALATGWLFITDGFIAAGVAALYYVAVGGAMPYLEKGLTALAGAGSKEGTETVLANDVPDWVRDWANAQCEAQGGVAQILRLSAGGTTVYGAACKNGNVYTNAGS